MIYLQPYENLYMHTYMHSKIYLIAYKCKCHELKFKLINKAIINWLNLNTS